MFSVGDKIELPRVEDIRYTPRKWPIRRILRNGETCTIVAEATVQVTKNLKAQEVTLDSGETVIVHTKGRKFDKVPRYKRILSTSGIPCWLRHEAIDNFRKSAASKKPGTTCDAISDSWIGAFSFRQERIIRNQIFAGLRPPQIGALHAIGAHWSLSSRHATIVMPTGTGKTETMISSLVAFY